jgi:adenylosuccinate synthase
MINTNIEQLNTTTKEIYGISKSNKKGDILENTIEDIIKNSFADYSYTNTSGTAHNGDGLLESPSGLKAIVELKNYIDFIEKEVEVPIKIVSVGPDRKQTITKF